MSEKQVNGNGKTLRWVLGILVGLLISILGAWATAQEGAIDKNADKIGENTVTIRENKTNIENIDKNLEKIDRNIETILNYHRRGK